MIDQFYTPGPMAVNIFAELEKCASVADFAIGDGSLIKNLPFQPEKIYGLDIDPVAINSLTVAQPKWILKTGDFLEPDDATIVWLDKLRRKVDLIVLNPPFSCKGRQRIKVTINGTEFTCRTAIAFLATALTFLKPGGQLIAILPLSSVKSEADTKILNEISQAWDIKFGDKFGPSTFTGCSPSSIVVTFKSKLKDSKKGKIIRFKQAEKSSIQIVRGTVTMPETKKNGKFPVLHTINLQQNKIKQPYQFTDKKIKYVSGTYLCLPRVCKPSKEKIVIIRNRAFVLSDCVFAIMGQDSTVTELLKQIILANWTEFVLLYESTCAPYITVAQLQSFFRSHGFASTICDGLHKDEQRVIEQNPLPVGYALSV